MHEAAAQQLEPNSVRDIASERRVVRRRGGFRRDERLPAADELLLLDLEVTDFAEFGQEADEV